MNAPAYPTADDCYALALEVFTPEVGLGVLIGAAGAVWLRPRMVGDSVQLWGAGRDAARRAVER